jgi:hypothetical protein
MTARQKLGASIVIWGIMLAAAIPFVAGADYWPFLYYHMYNRVYSLEKPIHRVELHGVPADPARGEFLLGPEHMHPFGASRLRNVLGAVMKRYRETPGRIHNAAGALFDHYEARRAAGHHEGPELRAVKIYRMSWKLDPWARNVDRPFRRQLVMEFSGGPRSE